MAEVTTASSGQVRCYPSKAPEVAPPLFDHGHVNITTHVLGWAVSGAFTLMACIISFWLINKHLQWYTNKKEQRYIIRILFMVPLYAVISLCSYLFWDHSTPIVLLRDCYEAFVLTAFFYLLLIYISPDPEEQKQVFLKAGLSRADDARRKRSGEELQKWVFPLGFIKAKPADGLNYLQYMKWGVLQYTVVRPGSTLAAMILNYVGLYCEGDWGPGWGYIYLTVIMSVSVSVAMYCLIQVYVTIAEPLKPYKPLLKLFAIKAVVFLTFWQATLLAVIALFGGIKDTPTMTAENVEIGLGAIAECVEMTLFAILHIFAFSYKPYMLDDPYLRTSRLKSLVHAMNFKEMIVEMWVGCVYMYRRMRGKENDKMVRRTHVFMEGAFGRSRIDAQKAAELEKDKSLLLEDVDGTDGKDGRVVIEVEKTVHVGAERQWLGVGNDYGYGLGYARREKSDTLGDAIQKELTIRGFGVSDRTQQWIASQEVDVEQGHAHPRQRSWWRNIYDRISQSGPDEVVAAAASPPARSRTRHKSKNALPERSYDDPPPSSALRTYRSSQGRHSVQKEAINVDLMMNNGQDIRPKPHPTRSDSLLARVFPHSPSPDMTMSAEGPVSSSQSHRTQVRLNAEPVILLNDVGSSRYPQLVQPQQSRPEPISEFGEPLSPPLVSPRSPTSPQNQHRFSRSPPSKPRSPQQRKPPHNPYPQRSLPPPQPQIKLPSPMYAAQSHPARKFQPPRHKLSVPSPLAGLSPEELQIPMPLPSAPLTQTPLPSSRKDRRTSMPPTYSQHPDRSRGGLRKYSLSPDTPR